MWIKICGIRDLATAQWIAELAPDAIGLNFYRGSPRCVDPTTARDITASLPDSVKAVGVFVDLSIPEIIRICHECQIDTAQLHGDYSLGDADACLEADLEVIRVIRFRGETWPSALTTELNHLLRHQCESIRYLVDAHVAGVFGGTGTSVPWDVMKAHWESDWPPLILAGGLTPDNVGEAIHTVHPFGVDVASGVESAPGVKDRNKVRVFIEAARGLSAGDSPGAK